ncbi:peptide chain release factor N(5)-glutamine methyltransferase [bacterium]|nr:peptide chain release factor N(5)-glutamine methyltransferase [bacterium]
MTGKTTIGDWQQRIEQVLLKAGIEAPQRTSRDLVCQSIGISKAALLTLPEKRLAGKQVIRLKKVLQARCRHVPLQYILGSEDFWGMTLSVGKGVLIPRPETELLLEVVKQRFIPKRQNSILTDLCTGSGNIALALGLEYPQATILAVDKSKRALAWARINKKKMQQKNIYFFLGDMTTAIPKKQYSKISLVTANPPYIMTGHMKQLQAEVRHEPRMALHGGVDGLRMIEKVVGTARQLLCQGGLCVCEIGIGQSAAVGDMFLAHGFKCIQILPDWQKIPRIVSAILPEK